MTYYHPATSTERGRLPKGADSNGQWIEPVTEGNAASCGWFPVVDVARPVSQASDWTRSITTPGGVPTVTWTARPWTQAELDAQTATTNATTIRDRAATALTTNATFLAKGSPTNLEVLAQVRALTKEVNALIRLALGQTADITDTA